MHNYLSYVIYFCCYPPTYELCDIFAHIDRVRATSPKYPPHTSIRTQPRTNLSQKSNCNLSFCWLTHYTQMDINLVGTWVLIKNTFYKSSIVHTYCYMPKIQQKAHELCFGCFDWLECEWSPFAAKRWQKWGPINSAAVSFHEWIRFFIPQTLFWTRAVLQVVSSSEEEGRS